MKRSIQPASFTGAGSRYRALKALQGLCNKVAQARQEVDAHAGVEAITVGAADGEKTDFGAVTKRHQRGRANLISIAVEQELALRIANFAATGTGAAEERTEGLECGVVLLDGPEESPGIDVLECLGVTKQHKDRVVGIKSRPHGLLDHRNRLVQVIGREQLHRQFMNLRGQQVVGTRHFNEFLELALQLQVLLPLNGNLALHQGDGTAAGVWEDE